MHTLLCIKNFFYNMLYPIVNPMDEIICSLEAHAAEIENYSLKMYELCDKYERTAEYNVQVASDLLGDAHRASTIALALRGLSNK